MRLVFLGQGIGGYLEASLAALSELGVDLFVVTPIGMPDTSFSLRRLEEVADVRAWSHPPAAAALRAEVDAFRPDVVMAGSFGRLASYRSVLRSRPPDVLRVMGMDHLWEATARQRLGSALHRWTVDPLFDCVFVPSDRTEDFALRLGFRPKDVIRGSYTADTDLFATGPRSGEALMRARRFLFAGRLAKDKAIDLLADAYRLYRATARDAWSLSVVGMGSMAEVIAGDPGVQMHGFLQPPELAELMKSVSCLVLPSWSEHYGVVVHEAAAAGLPLLVAHTAGSVPGLLQDGVNGRAVSAHTPQEWADAMTWVSTSSPARLAQMSKVSTALSTRLSPSAWALHLYEELARRLEHRRRGGRRGVK